MKNHVLLATVMLIAGSAAFTGCDKKPASTGATTGTKAESVRVTEVEWCGEHGVPESICTRCSPALIADFKQKGDWCDIHTLPKSQCIECDPSLKEKFAAMAPATGG